MRVTIHPAAFLGGSLVFCALWLAFRPPLPVVGSVGKPRSAAASVRTERASIKLAPSVLERYAGRYEGRADFTVELTLKDGRLFAQSPGTVQFEMLATSETEFFLKGAGVDVKFRFDGAGAVTGFDAATHYGPVSMDRVR
jgi:Domain of unknown function (DUF3471)